MTPKIIIRKHIKPLIDSPEMYSNLNKAVSRLYRWCFCITRGAISAKTFSCRKKLCKQSQDFFCKK